MNGAAPEERLQGGSRTPKSNAMSSARDRWASYAAQVEAAPGIKGESLERRLPSARGSCLDRVNGIDGAEAAGTE